MKSIISLILLGALVGCSAVPSAGPIAADINEQAGKSATERNQTNGAVFDVVDVTDDTARIIARFSSGMLRQRFGLGGRAGKVVIGIGDQLQVDIFEAGADGLFSTKESKRTSIDIVVQPNGNASIPYVGTVRFAGKTLEEAQATILEALKNKAIEPDVVINTKSTASRFVSVNGAVGAPSNVPLGLSGEKITEIISRAGGPVQPPYETYVTLVRGGKTGTVLLKTLIENPSDNVFVEPRDQIYVTYDPRTFTVLGAAKANARVPFGADDLNLLEAIALAGGGSDQQADAAGYFVFRYEEPEVVADVLGRKRFRELQAKGMQANRDGRYPIVYRFDMSKPDSLIIGQNFEVKNKDVIYVSRHLSVDFFNFMRLISVPLSTGIQASNAFN